MSVHQYRAPNKLALIEMGWDRPMQGFFMTVEAPGGGLLFDNLEQKDPFPKGINGFLEELKQLGIELPQTMIDGVLADGMHNIGNKIVVHVE